MDAYSILAEADAKSAEEARDYYRQGVDAGRRSLGEAFFAENAGHFWGMIETRPYMRASGAADCLWAMGQKQDSVAHSEALLDLNPSDNQGICDVLLSRYLALEHDAGAERLFRQYKDDWSAAFLWSRVLFDLRQGDQVAAKTDLKTAMKCNRHVANFFTGRESFRPSYPQSIAQVAKTRRSCMERILEKPGSRHLNAMEWLIDRLAN